MGPGATEVVTLADKTRVLLILPRDVLDRARVFAGKATTALKLPVSLQIVLRAMIEEGLKRPTDADVMANVERQAMLIRQIRSRGRRAAGGQANTGRAPAAGRRPPSRHRRPGRREGT
jgi:hypothetical protein